MTRKAYPDYHKFMMDQTSYPAAPRRIKFEETRNSLLYRTGEAVYKIRKTSPVFSSMAVKEAYAHEALTLSKRWAAGQTQGLTVIRKTPTGFVMDGQGEPAAYALKTAQLSNHFWMDYLLANDKVTPTGMGRLARYLAQAHQQFPAGEKLSQECGRVEHFHSLFEENIYQVKKYQDKAITAPMIDMITRPMERFFEDFRKLFIKRQKKGLIVEGHGHFIPEHIHIKSKDILAISPLEGQQKYRVLDAANDVATLLNALVRANSAELGDIFLKRYITASRDRDLPKILPAYQTFQALRSGRELCEWVAMAAPDEETAKQAHQTSHEFFSLAVKRAREIPRPG
ncbi:MAG: hypothetical protein OEW12_07215 [Deltaproteobacteria bacterium]|nr:hypothetical protein [Deltaproteobacteria bacterium]